MKTAKRKKVSEKELVRDVLITAGLSLIPAFLFFDKQAGIFGILVTMFFAGFFIFGFIFGKKYGWKAPKNYVDPFKKDIGTDQLLNPYLNPANHNSPGNLYYHSKPMERRD